ncbi:MAG: XylR family transcriptional regulator [Planctomycetia bacterium]|nr:XylR family transcriptional regulator [Planctomycetia bacterium]
MEAPKRVLLILEVSREHGRGIARGIRRYSDQNAHWWLICENRQLFEQHPHLLLRWQGDGIISRSGSPALSRAIAATGIPAVELYRDGPSEVESDGFAVGQMAAEHFIERGYQEYAYYAPWTNWWIQWRLEGYLKPLQERGFSVSIFPGINRKRNRSQALWEEKSLHELIDWLQSLPRPCCIYAPTDVLASHVLNGCAVAGINVPEELSVLGNDDDTFLCSFTFPSLSSIPLNSSRLGFEAAHLLDRRMNGTADSVKLPILIPPVEVVTRHSTDTIAVPDEDVVAALHYIRENATTNLLITDVVSHVGISQRNLQRRFQKWLGHSLNEELMTTRLKLAKKLLLDSILSVDQIARRTGFQTSRYFIHIFRSKCNMTPKQYRLLHRVSGLRSSE